MNETRAIVAAAGMSCVSSEESTVGTLKPGKPAGTSPTIATPPVERPSAQTTRVVATTTNNAAGKRGQRFLLTTKATTAETPIASVGQDQSEAFRIAPQTTRCTWWVRGSWTPRRCPS